MPTSTNESEIVTIKQVADYLKVTERTIYRLAAAKKIPAFKVGGMWRFSRADIENWIKQQSMEAGSYTHLPAHGNVLNILSRLLPSKKNTTIQLPSHSSS